jgi:hypothetical protein
VVAIVARLIAPPDPVEHDVPEVAKASYLGYQKCAWEFPARMVSQRRRATKYEQEATKPTSGRRSEARVQSVYRRSLSAQASTSTRAACAGSWKPMRCGTAAASPTFGCAMTAMKCCLPGLACECEGREEHEVCRWQDETRGIRRRGSSAAEGLMDRSRGGRESQLEQCPFTHPGCVAQ